MATAYLNGDYLPRENAKISVLDRGLLFGDGIYDVIPVAEGRMIAAGLHIQRLQRNLAEVGIETPHNEADWQQICARLLEENGADRPVYLQVTRGADPERSIAAGNNLSPTVIGFSLPSSNNAAMQKLHDEGYRVGSAEDIRWHRCDIKSTALLASAMSLRAAQAKGYDEVILYDRQQQLTEGGAVNVFVVRDGVVATPPLSPQLLPGITRHMLIDILSKHSSIAVQERDIDFSEVLSADEVWLSSSTKGVVAVVAIDGEPVADGKRGPILRAAEVLYDQHKWDY
ncbi:MAG: D-alanine aminotransferase [Gammaproteobacteria bacterium]|nr:D-alanine aminotransferase [Gammaproteobacteria bacterium]